MATTNPDLLRQIKKQNDYCRVTAWNDRGLTGKGVTVWNMENTSDHGEKTHQRILDAAPDATVITVGHAVYANNETVTEERVEYKGKVYGAEEFIKEFNIKIITRSVGRDFVRPDAGETKFWLDLQKRYNLIIFNAAGNSEPFGDRDDPVAMLVAAANLNKGYPRRDSYSAELTGLDFIDFRGWDTGTSFSSPYLAGKAALLVEKYGYLFTQYDCYEYFKMHSEDMEANGHDVSTGWGLPVMGDTKTVVTMRMNNYIMTVDDRKITMDECPVYNARGDRMLVPARYCAEAIGCETIWDEAKKTATFKTCDTTVEFTMGKYEMIINGSAVKIDECPAYNQRGDRMLVPVVFLTDAFKMQKSWNEAEKRVIFTKEW